MFSRKQHTFLRFTRHVMRKVKDGSLFLLSIYFLLKIILPVYVDLVICKYVYTHILIRGKIAVVDSEHKTEKISLYKYMFDMIVFPRYNSFYGQTVRLSDHFVFQILIYWIITWGRGASKIYCLNNTHRFTQQYFEILRDI